MAVGRKRKPTVLKILRGNPGNRPLNKNEPMPTCADMKPPFELSEKARAHWDIVAQQLIDANILSVIDTHALVLYCEAFAHYVEANAKLAQSGLIVKHKNGYPITSPYLIVTERATTTMLKIMVEFGMTPSSRAKIQKLPDATISGDSWDDF